MVVTLTSVTVPTRRMPQNGGGTGIATALYGGQPRSAGLRTTAFPNAPPLPWVAASSGRETWLARLKALRTDRKMSTLCEPS